MRLEFGNVRTQCSVSSTIVCCSRCTNIPNITLYLEAFTKLWNVQQFLPVVCPWTSFVEVRCCLVSCGGSAIVFAWVGRRARLLTCSWCVSKGRSGLHCLGSIGRGSGKMFADCGVGHSCRISKLELRLGFSSSGIGPMSDVMTQRVIQIRRHDASLRSVRRLLSFN